MSDSLDERPDGDGGEPDPDPRFALAAGVVVYGVMGGIALLWLWMRDRTDALAEQAVGIHGPFAASGLGLVVGLITAGVVLKLMARHPVFEQMLSSVQKVFARAPDGVGIAFVLIVAVAEELFFRLAVQDAFGLLGAVAIYVVLNTSVGGFRWFLFTVCHALALSSMVHFGFGLLSTTTAHAILNYLILRRVQDS